MFVEKNCIRIVSYFICSLHAVFCGLWKQDTLYLFIITNIIRFFPAFSFVLVQLDSIVKFHNSTRWSSPFKHAISWSPNCILPCWIFVTLKICLLINSFSDRYFWKEISQTNFFNNFFKNSSYLCNKTINRKPNKEAHIFYVCMVYVVKLRAEI